MADNDLERLGRDLASASERVGQWAREQVTERGNRMNKPDLAAIRARAQHLVAMRAVGDDGSFAGVEHSQLAQVAQSYAEVVPALLDRIFELEERLSDTDAALDREARECGMWHSRADAAMSIARAVAALDDTQIDFQCMHCLSPQLDDTDPGEFLHSGECPVTQARALLAGETPMDRRPPSVI